MAEVGQAQFPILTLAESNYIYVSILFLFLNQNGVIK